MIGFIVLAVFVCLAESGDLTQSSHVNLTQSAQVACLVTESGYEMKFFLEIGTDRVDLVYLISDSDSTVNSIGSFDSSQGFNGTGDMSDPFTFTITATGNITSPPLQLNTSHVPNFFAAYQAPDVIRVKVMSKSSYRSPFFHHILFPSDVIYTAACNFSELSDFTVTSGQLNVTGSIIESAKTAAESLAFDVKTQTGEIASTINLGDSTYLSISPAEPSYVEGLYVYNCSVCDKSDCSGVKITLIDVDGCSIGNVIQPFARLAAKKSTQTPEFISFKFEQSNDVFYRCVVDLCYSADDKRCDNYCVYNQNLQASQGRRRREAEDLRSESEQAVSTFVRITVNGRPSIPVDSMAEMAAAVAEVERKDDEMNTVLLASVIILAALLLIGLMASICIFMRLSSRQPNEKA